MLDVNPEPFLSQLTDFPLHLPPASSPCISPRQVSAKRLAAALFLVLLVSEEHCAALHNHTRFRVTDHGTVRLLDQ